MLQERLNEKSQGSEEVEALKRTMEEEKKRVEEEMKWCVGFHLFS